MRKHTIRIKWSYPVLLENIDNAKFKEYNGVYAISRVWGEKTSEPRKEKLLYIGKTERSFEQRIFEHTQYKLADKRGNMYVRFGIIQNEFTPEVLDDIESALICSFQPEWNRSKIKEYTYKSDYFVYIINEGYRGVDVIAKEIDAKLQFYK